MSNLTILKTSIRENDGLFSLNDLHFASGAEAKHRPNQFLRLDQTKELIAEMENENQPRNTILVVKNGLGSYACEELVLSYAMWISPKFHLIVLRAFLAMHKGEIKQQQLALPEPEKTFTLNWTESDLKHFASFWCAAFEMHQMLKYLDPILEQLGSKFSARVHSQVREYKRTLDSMHYRVSRDIDPLQYADPHNGHWQYCLNTINSYKRTAPKIALR